MDMEWRSVSQVGPSHRLLYEARADPCLAREAGPELERCPPAPRLHTAGHPPTKNPAVCGSAPDRRHPRTGSLPILSDQPHIPSGGRVVNRLPQVGHSRGSLPDMKNGHPDRYRALPE